MRVFVDSGIYIDYLQGKGVRLHKLQTFKDLLINKKNFKLIFPNVTKEEIYKGIPLDNGRYAKDKLEYKMLSVPAGVEDTENYKQAKKSLDELNEKIEGLKQDSLKSIKDILENYIEIFMDCAENIQEDQSVFEAAQIRKLKKNPPGKSADPLGDEIVWELLLQKYTDEELVIIVHDGDWKYNSGGKTQLHPFLQKEWEKNSNKKIKIYESINAFLGKEFDVKSSVEEKNQEEKIKRESEIESGIITGSYETNVIPQATVLIPISGGVWYCPVGNETFSFGLVIGTPTCPAHNCALVRR